MTPRNIVSAGLLALAIIALALPADQRVAPRDSVFSGESRVSTASEVSQRGGPMVAPVRRRMPVTPPYPEAILAAGDVEEPSRAPSEAPLPEQRNAELARAFLAAEAAATTETAEDHTGRAGTPVAATE